MSGQNVDSLYRAFVKADKAGQIEVVNQLSRELYAQEITDSLYQCNASTHPSKVEALMHYLKAEYYYDDEQYDEAAQEASQALELNKGRKAEKLLSDMLGVLSNSQFRIGDYSGALKTLLEAYRVDKKLSNKELISSDLNSLAAIYLAVGQPKPGLKFIDKAIAIERELGRQDRLATRLGMASELYLLNDESDKAMDAIVEAYTIDHSIGKEEKAAVRMVQKAAILEHQGHLNEAKGTILKVIPLLEDYNNNYSLAIAYNQLAAIEHKTGHTAAATAYYKKALENSVRCGSPKVERTAERGLWETMRDSNPNVALIHLERYTVLTDSMHNKMSTISQQVMEVTAQNIEQSELDKKSRFVDNLLKWGTVILGLMLAALSAGMFHSWRKGKKVLAMQRQTQEMRSHFFTNITNELQTPLTVVMNAGQQLMDAPKGDIASNRRIGEMIVSHGKNMLWLVNQLLDIEKTRDGGSRPETKNGDIVMFVRLLVNNYLAQAHQQLINLSFYSPVNSLIVEFTPDYIRKIVHRLLDCAFHFTPHNGSIRVALEPVENEKMRLTVSDTGKGIPAEERDRIFEPFSQSINGDDAVGIGLDLSLVNQIVQAMKGTISVDTELGRGTAVTIEFPMLTDKNLTEKEEKVMQQFVQDRVHPALQSKHKPLAFIVENDEDVAYFTANLLSNDFDLRFALDGQEALDNAQEMIPDLIITNMLMPSMDGKELMRRVRANSLLNHIPIIALTADSSEQERLDCIRAGADAVLVKPFNSSELQLIANHLITQRMLINERAARTETPAAESPDTAMSKEDKNFINRLIGVIHAQMGKGDINIDHIAAALTLSRKQLRTRVMDITGLTPVAFVLQVKLNYARRLIASEDTSLTVIASRCGFQNLSHFSKVFKQQFGISPLQYRKSSGNDFTPPPIN